MVLWEFADGATIEYSPVLAEELRRLAVDGLVAFQHGGLEVGGVLYGTRAGNRVSVVSFAELLCEHAFGPGFVLSENDTQTLIPLLDPPAGLQTVGWFRAHTRRGLELDASDHVIFDRFFAGDKCIGLVLKPTQWGPSGAAFCIRDTAGEIMPLAPREFTIQPPQRPQRVSPASEFEAQPGPLLSLASAVESEQDAVFVPHDGIVNGEPEVPGTPLKHRLRFAIAGAAALGIAAAIYAFYWFGTPRNLELKAYAIARGQVRIEWNHHSRPVLDGVSANLQIRDGLSEISIPLDANQLRSSSITYTQTTGHLTVRMHVVRRGRNAAPAEESIEVVGPPQPSALASVAEVPPAAPGVNSLKSVVIASPPPAVVIDPAPTPRKQPDRKPAAAPVVPPEASIAARPRFQVSPPVQNRPASTVAALPAAPSVPALVTPASPLPDFSPQPPPALQAPPGPKAISIPSAGPRSGRLIWTGELGRRGVVEIEGTRASIGSLSGSLTGVPATLRVSPAEFTREGLAVYTADVAANGRREPASQANGWNVLHFQYDPERARELVVLEAPNRVNDYKRLVLRNDARACPVIVVDWMAQ